MKKIKKLIKVSHKNYFLVIFFAAILFVGIIAGYRLFLSKPTYVYARVQMGQGLWWATTAKPYIWYVDSLNKGDVAVDLFGKKEAEILSKRYYRWYGNDQYDIYLTMRLKVGFNKRTGEYSFNRSSLSVGSPIELQFPRAAVTGTVIELSPKPFADKYVKRTVYLVNQGGYAKDFPTRYETIRVGDKYFDGEATVFEVLDKSLEKNIWSISNNLTGDIYEREISTNQNIVIKAQVLLKQKSDGLYYTENYKVIANAFIPFATRDYLFEDFVIRKLE